MKFTRDGLLPFVEKFDSLHEGVVHCYESSEEDSGIMGCLVAKTDGVSPEELIAVATKKGYTYLGSIHEQRAHYKRYLLAGDFEPVPAKQAVERLRSWLSVIGPKPTLPEAFWVRADVTQMNGAVVITDDSDGFSLVYETGTHFVYLEISV